VLEQLQDLGLRGVDLEHMPAATGSEGESEYHPLLVALF
jgi:hypothetical protein